MGRMSLTNTLWEMGQRLRENADRAAIGVPLPRQPIPIERLFTELNRDIARRFAYRPLGCPPPMRRGRDGPV